MATQDSTKEDSFKVVSSSKPPSHVLKLWAKYIPEELTDAVLSSVYLEYLQYKSQVFLI